MSRVFNDETGGHGGDLARAAELWDPAGGELIDFSSNINPLGPPPGLIEHLAEALPEIVAYPTPQARKLREKLAAYLGVDSGRLLLGNGANELIHLLLLWRRPARVFVPAPAFSEYERAARLSGAEVKYYALPPGRPLDPFRLANELKEGDLLIFCNPHNPSGMLYNRRDLEVLADGAERQGAGVMIDESFIPLTGRPEESLRERHSENFWVVISLTKLWGLPGLRLGCALGPVEEVAEISRWGDPWRVNILAQKAGLYCLQQGDYLARSLAVIAEERDFLAGSFKDTSAFRVFESATNFLLLQGLVPAFNVADFQDFLARRGVLIRRADNFKGLDQSYFRLAVRRRPENLRLLRETKAYLAAINAADGSVERGGEEK